jgi:hypothetical protein
MIKKSIAALVLVTLGWLSVPVAVGSPTTGAMHSAHRNASPGQDHSCCPGPRSRMVPVLSVVASFPAMPCGEQHPCCAKQRPASPSSTPVESKVIRPAVERMLANVAGKVSESRSRLVEVSPICFLAPPFERSAVLRI